MRGNWNVGFGTGLICGAASVGVNAFTGWCCRGAFDAKWTSGGLMIGMMLVWGFWQLWKGAEINYVAHLREHDPCHDDDSGISWEEEEEGCDEE